MSESSARQYPLLVTALIWNSMKIYNYQPDIFQWLTIRIILIIVNHFCCIIVIKRARL